MEVKGEIARFGHAPRAVARLAERPLRLDGRARRSAQQRVGRRAEDQLRHQVFKHRAAPRGQRRAVVRRDGGARQLRPVAHGRAAEHDRDIAQYAGFRGEQVVVGVAQAAVFDVRADAEQVALRVVERGEVHSARQRAHPAGQRGIFVHNHLRAQQQRRREVSAVDGGDVLRTQRRKRVDVVPVVQVAAPLFQALEHAGGLRHARARRIGREEAQLARGGAAHQIETDVCRRRPPRRADWRVDLDVVRREKVLVCADVCLEEAPDVARKAGQQCGLGFRDGFGVLAAGFLEVAHPFRADGEHRRQCCRGQRPAWGQQAGEQQDRRRTAGLQALVGRGVGVGRSHPVQQVPPGERQPPERAEDRVECAGRRRRQDGQLHRRAPPRMPAARVQDGRQEGEQHRREQRALRGKPDGLNQQRQQRRGAQAAQQVVQQADARRRAEPLPVGWVALRAEQHRQQLPVAAGPAVQPLEPAAERGGKAVVEADVADERRLRQCALDQVVAQDAPLGQRAVERGGERAHVVQPLAAEDALAGDVLPEVGDRRGVGIQPAVAGEQPHEIVCTGARRHFHLRLQHGVSAADGLRGRAAGGFSERILCRGGRHPPGRVERMCQRADQAARLAREEARVGVDGQHKAELFPQRTAGRAFGVKGRFCAGLAQQQPVEVGQRAALPVAAHPAAVGLEQLALAMQVEAALASGAGVDLAHALPGALEDFGVAGRVGRVAVGEVAQDQVLDVLVRFETAERLDLVADFLRAARRRE